MNTTPLTERASDYIAKLMQANQDRGKMAALRRGLTDNGKPQAWAVIAGLGGLIDSPAYVVSGGLFALHPSSTESGNMGSTCRQVARARGSDLDRFAPRFNRLISCQTAEELALHLPGIVTLAKGSSIPINYQQLFCDLWNWRWYQEEIKVRWAKEFWHDSSENTEIKSQSAE